MLKIIVLVFLVLLVVVTLVALKSKAASSKGATGIYTLRKALFTPAERSFLGVLDPMLPSQVRVFGKVRLGDIFAVKSGLDRGANQAGRNRIDRKHIDFLLVRADDLTPIAGIELDDRSHETEVRQERDAFVDDVFKSAGLPLLHVPAQASYNPIEVRTKIAALLS